MLEICEKYKNQAPENVMFPEPYLPYMPDKPKKWNGILVLAEAQGRSSEYEERLRRRRTSVERMTRLGWKKWKEPPPLFPNKPNWIGVGPWDDKTVKLALQAVFEGANLNHLKLEDVAVSNAVPWTKKRSGSKNENPDEYMKAKAKDFWKDIFDVWKPEIKVLVVLGNIAEEIMNAPGIKEKYEKSQLQFATTMARIYKSGKGNV